MGYQHKGQRTGTTLYSEVTDRIIAQLEEGVLPWVKPWDDGRAPLGLPRNGQTGRCYSGINVLILWHTLFHRRFHSQRWVTFRQALAMGGNVRVGLEDNLYVGNGQLATNAKLVDKAVNIIESMGARVIGPAEVREKLKLTKRAPRG